MAKYIDLIEKLDSSSDSWANSDFPKLLEQVRITAENLIEDNRQLDSAAKIFRKKLIQFSDSDDNAPLPLVEFGKTIRLFQKEIETVSKRIIDSSELINSLRLCLSNLPDIVPILSDSLNFFESLPAQKELLNSLRNDINSLKTPDDEITKIEKQIQDVKLKRDIIISGIKNEVSNNMEVQKSLQVQQILQSINEIQEKKEEIEFLISKYRTEINEFDQSKGQIEQTDQENIKRFIAESTEIENEIMENREKLENLRQIDLRSRFESARNELSQKNAELLQKQNLITSLKTELNVLSKGQKTVDYEAEVTQLEDRLREAQSDLESAPSMNDWRKIQDQLKLNQKVPSLSPDVINGEILVFENKLKNINRNYLNTESQIKSIGILINRKKEEIEKLREQNMKICESKDETAIVDVLKNRKKELNDSVLQKENELHDLQREQDTLDIRIRSLKDEKESLINFTSGNVPISRQKVKKSKMKQLNGFDRFLLMILNSIIYNPGMGFAIIVYVLLLHVLVFYVVLY